MRNGGLAVHEEWGVGWAWWYLKKTEPDKQDTGGSLELGNKRAFWTQEEIVLLLQMPGKMPEVQQGRKQSRRWKGV